jgi:hypothetical protein
VTCFLYDTQPPQRPARQREAARCARVAGPRLTAGPVALGRSVHRWANGVVYDGEWQHGVMHGRSRVTKPHPPGVFECVFRRGELQSQVEATGQSAVAGAAKRPARITAEERGEMRGMFLDIVGEASPAEADAALAAAGWSLQAALKTWISRDPSRPLFDGRPLAGGGSAGGGEPSGAGSDGRGGAAGDVGGGDGDGGGDDAGGGDGGGGGDDAGGGDGGGGGDDAGGGDGGGGDDGWGGLPEGWEERVDARGRVFFLDHTTRTSHWELPPKRFPRAPPRPAADLPDAPAAAAPAAQGAGQVESEARAEPSRAREAENGSKVSPAGGAAGHDPSGAGGAARPGSRGAAVPGAMAGGGSPRAAAEVPPASGGAKASEGRRQHDTEDAAPLRAGGGGPPAPPDAGLRADAAERSAAPAEPEAGPFTLESCAEAGLSEAARPRDALAEALAAAGVGWLRARLEEEEVTDGRTRLPPPPTVPPTACPTGA